LINVNTVIEKLSNFDETINTPLTGVNIKYQSQFGR